MSSHVFVLGATGYIGLGVARAFRRAGYVVYGSTRNKDKFSELIQHEIIPVYGDQSTPEVFEQQLRSSSVIIDAVGYSPESPSALDFFSYLKNLKQHTLQNYKPVYIFTSGIMTYASGGRVDFPIDESIEPQPKDEVEMIPKKHIEDTILSAPSSIAPIVIRPGFVYGLSGGLIAKFFFDVQPDQKEIIAWGSLDKRWSWVHVDDLGEAYVKIAKLGAPVVSNQIFNIAALGDNPTFLELKYHGAKAAGWKGSIEDIKSIPIPESQNRAKNWEWNVVINPAKLMDWTGWRPSHVGVIHEMELYEKSWRLSQKQ